MLTAFEVLAENNFGDTRTGGVAGPMGLFILVLLVIATVLLIRNMNARLRRLPDRFPDQKSGQQSERDRDEDDSVLDPTVSSAAEPGPDAAHRTNST